MINNHGSVIIEVYVLTQELNVRTDKFWTLIEAVFKQTDTSGMEFEVRAAGNI